MRATDSKQGEHRSAVTRAAAIAALLALAAPLAWLGLRRADPRATALVPSERAALEPSAADGAPLSMRGPTAPSDDAALRESVVPGGVDPAAVAEPAPRVRVHGRVWRGGRPVEGVALAFVRSEEGASGDDVDWDLSDEDGTYEVRLPAASYRVVGDDGEISTQDVSVPSGLEELACDIHLMVGWIEPATGGGGKR